MSSEGKLDPELARLLLDELARHLVALADGGEVLDQKRALHALKGSAAIAGQRAFSEALGRLERRLVTGDARAAEEARAKVAEAILALEAGKPVPGAVWPEPPDDLVAGERAAIEGRYAAEMADRVARIDRALALGEDVGAVTAAYREVHAMKGAALAANDEPTAWFCHGLEERLRGADRTERDARRALAELTRWRGVLAEMIAAPARALETLRIYANPSRASALPPEPEARRDSSAIPRSALRSSADFSEEREGTLRVATATLDRVVERVRSLSQTRAEVTDGGKALEASSKRARQLRMLLTEALRFIGPPRPWGAPHAAIHRIEEARAAVAEMAEQLEAKSVSLKEAADRIRLESASVHGDLAAVRTTKVASLFDRVAHAVLAEARREGREVRMSPSGEEIELDRRVAEELYDPVLQLARNAVAHGIESVAERALRGKPRVGVVQLTAERRSGGLRVVVQDDGAGVNAADLRARAVARGVLAADVARGADDATLLALLFVPGFTTRESADLLAGRGVGLDVALDAVERLGGTIRLSSEPGMGFAAAIDVPIEPGIMRVLWIEIDGTTYALPAQHARRILARDDPDAAAAVPLRAVLRGRPPAEGDRRAFAVEIDPPRRGAPAPLVSVDAVGIVEEVALRGVSPLVTSAGPYAGAIVRGSELLLCLDATVLAERVAASTRS